MNGNGKVRSTQVVREHLGKVSLPGKYFFHFAAQAIFFYLSGNTYLQEASFCTLAETLKQRLPPFRARRSSGN